MAATWGRITAGEIAVAAKGALLAGSARRVIAGVTTDTRTLRPGELFWALVGERFDGHEFMGAALERGAAGVVGEKARVEAMTLPQGCVAVAVEDPLTALGNLASWWRHAHRAEVAALTGSAGKTTTKEMAAAVLDLNGTTLRNRGNFNNLIGLPLTLFALGEEHRYAVLEMGMNRPGEIGRLTEIADPEVGLITNVARAHLEGVGDIRDVARAKGELLDRMRREATAVLNGDDALLMAEARRFQGNVVTFGLGSGNRVRAERVRPLGRGGARFDLVEGEDRTEIRLRVPGRQNVLNALAASAVACSLGVDLKTVSQGLERFKGVPGRFTVLDLPGGGILVDDTYNANPSSLEAALDSLADLTGGQGRVIVCLGDMLELGRETVSAHLEAGEMAAERGAAHLLVLGEQADHVIRGALDRGFAAERAHRMRDHEEMVNGIMDLLEDGDVVLIKGSRGMRLEKVVERVAGADRKGGRHGLDPKGSGGG
jgi:UDP-N-acetylmuramoyl-tripeptide--D-alanyl-D-alanine ligase